MKKRLAPVVLTLDRAIHGTNHYPLGKYYGNQLRCPKDRDLSSGQRYLPLEQLGPGGQIKWIHTWLNIITHIRDIPDSCLDGLLSEV